MAAVDAMEGAAVMAGGPGAGGIEPQWWRRSVKRPRSRPGDLAMRLIPQQHGRTFPTGCHALG
ncbi:protein of unknown function [Methylorubrum extorquens]|uniref:Uncharacterized protein n=1 Tax=Methylorubrum extorquens TaxID=408 RepID=A0A2N9AVU1_METEX|nr:protein of unknown function [Methylorubrum extorquens]